MHDTLRSNIYLSYMAADVGIIVITCPKCARNNSRYCCWRKLKLFLAFGPLDFFAKKIVRKVSKRKQSSQYILVNTDRYSKLTRVITKSKTTATHIGNDFFHHWRIPHSISTYKLTDKGSQLAADLYSTICAFSALTTS